MIDPELKENLEKIEGELKEMRVHTASFRQTLVRGAIYGAGYVIGAVLIVLVVGWILDVVGVIPAFSREVTAFRTALENTSHYR